MQNIEAILTELGIEVPADKKENLTKKVAENYITKAEHEKKLGKVETDRGHLEGEGRDGRNHSERL